MKITSKSIIKELIIWGLMAIPFVYYGILYNSLPEQIPIHFDINGTPDNFANKVNYWWVLASTILGVYLLMLIIPLIDPKRKIQQMGNKYYIIKLLLVGIIALMDIIMIYVAQRPNIDIHFVLYLVIGLMFIIIGNYMPSFKPNYFLGIRTPWTLESEEIWRKTHYLGGWLWVIAGLIIIILSLIKIQPIALLIIILIAAFTPVIYSFILYLKNKKE